MVVGMVLGSGCDYPELPELLTAPGCQGLPATCGPSSADDCCNPGSAMPGGTYYRSYDVAGVSSSGNTSYPATVSTFRLDKYEVTVGRFRAFVNAGKGTQASPPVSGAGAHAAIAGSGWNTSWNTSLTADKAALIAAVKCGASYQTWTDDSPGANEARPMNCITWYEAMAFCIWDGGYLPTEVEWNYAATGGSEQRAYPWSSPAGSLSIDATRANYSSTSGAIPVGAKSAGDGRWGQSDLAGNVWEWTLDWYRTYVTSCSDCAQVESGTSRVIRGGSFNSAPANLRAGYRGYDLPPAYRNNYIGVRCARTP